MRGLPRLPLVVWAGFDAGLRDGAALVDWAAEGLRLGFWATGADLALWDAWPDLTRGCLAGLETVVSAGTDAGIDG